MRLTKFRFLFTIGNCWDRVSAFSITEARILAQAERIKNALTYTIIHEQWFNEETHQWCENND